MEAALKKTFSLKNIIGFAFAIVILAILFYYNSNAAYAKAKTLKHLLYKQNSVKLKTIIEGSNLSKAYKKNWKKYTFKLSKKSVVKLSKKKITAKKKGSVTIKGYKTIKKKITVKVKDEDTGEEVKKKKTVKKKSLKLKIKITVQNKPSLVRTLLNGKVKGKTINSNQAMVWYALHYGQNTAGKNRWRAPKKIAPWSGTLNLTSPKQDAYSTSNGTEDCLYVNVFRPYNNDTDLPVLVYLHGGGNTSGTANDDYSDFAKKCNAIVVSVSFRLGAFGFFSHPAMDDGRTAEEKSGNYALLDIKASLEYIKENIKCFGGNPENVTLSGFSAGARDVLMCCMSPIFKGLFSKAIIFNGGLTFSTPKQSENAINKALANILVSKNQYRSFDEAYTCICNMQESQIRQIIESLTANEISTIYKGADLDITTFPQGYLDGVVLPTDINTAISTGCYNKVPMIVGSDATEFGTFAWNTNISIDEKANSFNKITPKQSLAILEKAIKYGSMLQSCFYVEKLIGDLYKDINHSDIYAYRFFWGTDEKLTGKFYSTMVGAYHGCSKNFVFGKYPNKQTDLCKSVNTKDNEKGRLALTNIMRSYIKKFMLTGNPNDNINPFWTKYNNVFLANKIMRFDANAAYQSSKMISQSYDENAIFDEMNINLSADEYNLFLKTFYKNRFFMS